MATALVLIALGIAILLRGRKLADGAASLQEGTPANVAGLGGDFTGAGGAGAGGGGGGAW